MLWIVIGMFLGGTWAWQAHQHPSLGVPLRALTDTLSDYANRAVAALFRMAGSGIDVDLQHVFASIAAVIAPGLVCLLLAMASVAGRSVRRAARALILFGAIGAFWFLPIGSALTLLVLSLVAIVLLSLAGGLLMDTPIALVVTAVCGTILLGISSPSSVIASSSETLAVFGGTVGIWQLTLAVLTVVVAGSAIVRLFIRTR